MEQYLIGKIIKEFRLRNNFSQEKLVGTTCAISTLSRIENGDQIPNRKLVEALFSKMGIEAPLHAVPMSNTDLERWNLEYEIEESIVHKNYEIQALLEKYHTLGPELNVLEQQFYIFYTAIYSIHHNGNFEKNLFQLEKARQLTMKKYIRNKQAYPGILTEIECLIIHAIAVVFYNLKHINIAICILKFLMRYFESHTISENKKENDYTTILYTLSTWLYSDGQYTEALSVSEKGIKVCISYGLLTLFPCLLFNKGICLHQLGQEEIGKKIINHSLLFMCELGKHDEAVVCAKKIKEKFNLDI